MSDAGLAGVAPVKPGPKGASKLTPAVVARIRSLEAEQKSLAQIAAAVGVSTFSVRVALGRVAAKTTDTTASESAIDTAASIDEAGAETRCAETRCVETRCAATDAKPTPGPVQQLPLPGWDNAPAAHSHTHSEPIGQAEPSGDSDTEPVVEAEPVAVLAELPDVVCRAGERGLARTGLLECAGPVFAPGARYPLVGLLVILPALAEAGLLDVAEQVYGKLRNGFYGLTSVVLEATFRALLGAARAEATTRIPPPNLGRVLGLDRAPEVKTIRRKVSELAARGKAADLVAGIAARHAARRPEQVGFLYRDGHVRLYCGTRTVQKTHVARLRFPTPATVETWFNDAGGQPVFVVPSEPSASLASELRRLLPDLRAVVGPGRAVTVGFDRGGWSPAVFADLIEAIPHPDLPQRRHR